MKKLMLLAFLGIAVSCANQSNDKEAKQLEEQDASKADASKIGRENYAVIWEWSTKDSQLMTDDIGTITEELMNLWEQDVIENAYFNIDAENQMLGDFPNISFFIKAQTTQSAKQTLDALSIVKKGISTYRLVPVGMKWLGRNTEKVFKTEKRKTFVAVWTNNKELEISESDSKIQMDAILTLWNSGTIENVYFDLEGTQKENSNTDFVFFINAKSEEEAKGICDKLPFSLKSFASYVLHPVGLFWMGEYSQ